MTDLDRAIPIICYSQLHALSPLINHDALRTRYDGSEVPRWPRCTTSLASENQPTWGEHYPNTRIDIIMIITNPQLPKGRHAG